MSEFRWCEEESPFLPASRCPGSFVFLNNSLSRYPGYLIRFGSMRVGGVYVPQIRLTLDCRVPGRAYYRDVSICFHFTVRYLKRKGAGSRNIGLDIYICDRVSTVQLRRAYLRWLRRRGISLRRLQNTPPTTQRRLLNRFYQEYLLSIVERLMRYMDRFLTQCFKSIHCVLHKDTYISVWLSLDREPRYWVLGQLFRLRLGDPIREIDEVCNIATPWYRCPSKEGNVGITCEKLL